MAESPTVEEILKFGFKKTKRKWTTSEGLKITNDFMLKIDNYIFYLDNELTTLEVYTEDGYDGSEDLESINLFEYINNFGKEEFNSDERY